MANPQIGAFRDWDVFAFAGLPLTLLAAVSLIQRVSDNGDLSRVVTIVCGVAAINTAVWIGVNADVGLAENRFRANLNRGFSIHAQAYGWDTLGSYYETHGDLPGALESFVAAAETHPVNYRYWKNAGTVAGQLGQYQIAVDFLKKAAAAEPRAQKDRDLYYNLGNALRRVGEREEAIQAFQRAIELNPHDTDAYNNMAIAYLGLDHFEEAQKAYEAALSINGSLPQVHYNLGGILNRLELHDQAIAAYLRAIELNPNYAKAYFNLAYSYQNLGQLERALETYMKARTLGADWPQLYMNAAAVLHGLGREEEAAEWKMKAEKGSTP